MDDAPEKSLQLITKFMFSLIMPLMLSIIAWLWQLITVRSQRKIALRLFSWGIVAILFMFYLEVFSAQIVLGWFWQSEQYVVVATTVVVFVIALLAAAFPYGQIMNAYRALTAGNEFWSKRDLEIWAPYLVGMVAAGLFIMLPFLL